MRLDAVELSGLSTAYPGTVRLDVRALPQLVALCGPIGNGKTLLLESGMLAVHRQFPSREDALVDFATRRDSYVASEWTIGDRRFRTRVALDGERRQVKAVIEEIDTFGAGIPLNTDGLTTTFDTLVAERFASWELTLASVFACQTKRGSFTEMREGKRIELFAEMLGLAGMQARAETAGKAAALVEAGRQRLLGQREAVLSDTSDAVRQAIGTRADALQVELGTLELRRQQALQRLEQLRTERAALVEQAEAHRTAVARVAMLAGQIGAGQHELRSLEEQADTARTAASEDQQRADGQCTRALDDLTARARVLDAELTAALASIDEKLANNRTELLDRASAIRAAVEAKADAEQQLFALRNELADVRGMRQVADEQRQVRQQKLDRLALKRQELDAAKTHAAICQTVKFGERCAEAPACQFISAAVAAQGRIPDLEGAMANEVPLADGIVYWTRQVDDHDVTLDRISGRITLAEQRVAEHTPLANRAAKLAEAQARIEELQQQRDGLDAAHPAKCAELAARHVDAEKAHDDATSAIADRLDARLAQLTLRRLQADDAIQAATVEQRQVQQQVEATAAAAQRLDVTDAEIEAARSQASDAEVALAGLGERRAALEREREAFARAMALRQDLDRRLATLDDMLRVWNLNAKALGKDGLQRLEIDAAGPAVTMATNDLLLAAGMSRFTTELVTQIDRADGKGQKDRCELLVWDNEHGGAARKLSGLSGGQRTIVEEAFRSAVALYNNLKNEQPIRTCWRDETISALDAETAPQYVAMLRRFVELGRFEQLLFVSHNLECAALADAQVLVANGAIEVVQRSEAELAAWLADVSAQRRAA